MHSHTPVRIAMWSGPRNISTAMLRSWENRGDTAVSDEPLYAYFLKRTGLDHPGADEVIAAYPTDWRAVAAGLTGPIPDGKRIWYQKHMTHHILPEVELDWIDELVNCFLIRRPAEVILSYVKVRPEISLEDTGLPQQQRLFEHVRERTGRVPPVVDAGDVLDDPRRTLGLLCEAVGVPFRPHMLAWPPGPRPSDGVWAKYWYAAVERSTRFEQRSGSYGEMPSHLRGLAAECEAIYAEMQQHRLR